MTTEDANMENVRMAARQLAEALTRAKLPNASVSSDVVRVNFLESSESLIVHRVTISYQGGEITAP